MIRIGVIGAGPNAAGHARYFARSGRSKVVAIADPDLNRAHALASECQASAMEDYRDMLGDVDAVVVSSPNFLHHEHAVAAAKAGKHVYCEKPMGLSLAQATEIRDAIAEASVQSLVGFSTRFTEPVQTMLRLSGSGQLGKIISVDSRRLCNVTPAPPKHWRHNPSLSGGLLYEINIHEIDWMLAAGGPVESCYARSWAVDQQSKLSNDHIWVILNFKSGATGMHEGSWVSATPHYYRAIHGTSGAVATDEWGATVYYGEPGEERRALVLDPHFDLRGNFLDTIDHIAEPVADATWGLEVMRVAEAILKSAHSGNVELIGSASDPVPVRA
jgi:predicted dehydrogenase